MGKGYGEAVGKARAAGAEKEGLGLIMGSS